MSFLEGDEEKQRDFDSLTKEEFLKSYSYITEEEYNKERILNLCNHYNLKKEYVKSEILNLRLKFKNLLSEESAFYLLNKKLESIK